MSCELLGCIYNDDGDCEYLNAPIRMPYARACHEPFEEPYEGE